MPSNKVDPEALAINRIVRILTALPVPVRSRICNLLNQRYGGILHPEDQEPWRAPWEVPAVPPTAPLACPHGHTIDEPCKECGSNGTEAVEVGRKATAP